MINSDFTGVMEKIRVHLSDKYNKKIYDKDIALYLGISKEHFSRLKKGNKIPLESIISFCAKENIVINYILFGQIPDSLEKATDNLITVKYFKNINSSAGGGAFNYEEDFESLILDDDVVKLLGGKNSIKNIEAINVVGDSMEPILKDKSIIFIDRSKTQFSNNEIYVVNTNQGVLVKRITIKKYNFIDLVSENNQYPNERVFYNDVSIIGKVIGVSEGLI
jgi:DNA-binding Xre family transcriptional regulator